MKTDYRAKAAEYKAEGEAKRGDFEPTGVPLRMYDYWLRQSNSKRARQVRSGSVKENFCHFWRVVAIWAPMQALGNVAYAAGPWIAGAGALAALVAFVYAIFFVGNFFINTLVLIGGMLAMTALLLGFASGIALTLDPDTRHEYDLPNGKFMKTFAVLGAPATLLGYLISKTVQVTTWGFKNHFRTSRAVALGSGTTIFFGVIGLIGGLPAMVITLGVILGSAAIVVGAFYAAAFASTYIEGKREVDRNQVAAFLNAYREETGENYVAPARKPSKTKGFLRGTGDFIILIAQVVRVNKWKICPTVSIETNRNYY